MSKLATQFDEVVVVPEQPPRPPKSPPRSPLIKFPSIEKLPEQQPPAPTKKPEIIRFPPYTPPEIAPPLPPEEQTHD